jgi:plastocyanin
MKVKKEVDIVLISIIVLLFFCIGSYIGFYEEKNEPIIKFNKPSVWGAGNSAGIVVPEEELVKEPEEQKEPFLEMPAVLESEEEPFIIEIKDTTFYPSELSITVGTKITWINKDAKRNYQVYERSASQIFNSFRLMPGHEFSYIFNKTGTYNFNDAVFTYMKGKITVTE